MKIKLQNVLPGDIEKRSFEIIGEELALRGISEGDADPLHLPIIKRAIHTSADFDYFQNLKFSEGAVKAAAKAIRSGALIITDTEMGKAGINKKLLSSYGGQVLCFMGDEDVAKAAKEEGTTRATAAVNKALTLDKPIIFAVGNAPTALIRLYELMEEEKIKPELIIGVPVGFVNVVESKELIMSGKAPYIVAEGRKGGSNVAAAICNGILYMMEKGEL